MSDSTPGQLCLCQQQQRRQPEQQAYISNSCLNNSMCSSTQQQTVWPLQQRSAECFTAADRRPASSCNEPPPHSLPPLRRCALSYISPFRGRGHVQGFGHGYDDWGSTATSATWEDLSRRARTRGVRGRLLSSLHAMHTNASRLSTEVAAAVVGWQEVALKPALASCNVSGNPGVQAHVEPQHAWPALPAGLTIGKSVRA